VLITAAVLRAADAPYAIERVELDDPGPGEVLVKIAGAGLCHTDLLGRSGLVGLPVILGHEGSGIIEAVGPGVTDLAVGDHVVLSFDSCGTCTNCRAAHPAYCAEFFPRNLTGLALDGSTRAAGQDGKPIAARWFGQSSLAPRSAVWCAWNRACPWSSSDRSAAESRPVPHRCSSRSASPPDPASRFSERAASGSPP
jgi:aryl-alcohol dehydrogenase